MINKSPEIHLSEAAEQPVFFWSFQEKGLIGTPHNTNTDIVITTGRVLLWSRTLYKTFDCKTSCLWGFCWCACCRTMFCAKRLPSSMSFLTLSSLLTFSTETTMEPPVWYDPHHPPIRVPCFDEFC